ncbi:MAG: response regulator [Mariprofundales bacterium]
MISPTPQTILIVEDDPTMAHIADSRCTAYGYQTHCVSNGEQALQWIRHHQPDLMLVDITLPGMNGLDCIEQVRQLTNGVDINILIVSSCEDGDLIDRAFTLGVDDFIQKPVNWQILIQRIQRILHSKQVKWEVDLLYNAATNGHDAILITDSKNRICYVNPAFSKVTGYAREEVQGKNPSLLASGKHPKSFYQAMWQQINEQGEWKGVITDRHKDGSLFEHGMRISAMHRNGNADLPVSHYIAVSTDATQEIARERLAREQVKMKSIITTVGGVAHNFNNMLAGIVGNSFLINYNVSHPEKLKKYVQNIDALSQQGAGLIKQLLAFVQHDMARMEAVVLNESIEAAIARQTIPVRYQRASSMLKISADQRHLEEMLDALLNNAIDAINGRNDGTVTIELQRVIANEKRHPTLKAGCAYAKVSVVDNGHGMDPETKARIFDPFFTTKPVDQGTGLGLSMLHGSMATHDGCVQVTSTEHKGSCFTLYFPLLEDHLSLRT